MNKKIKIVIVVILVLVVAVVFAVKQNQKVKPSEITKGDESSKIIQIESNKKESLPKLIDLGADKCVPCKMMAPILEELKKEYEGRFDVEFIDVWKIPDAGKAFNIKLIPTQLFFDKDGNELFRHEGFFSKEDILAKWEELGIKFEEKKIEMKKPGVE